MKIVDEFFANRGSRGLSRNVLLRVIKQAFQNSVEGRQDGKAGSKY